VAEQRGAGVASGNGTARGWGLHDGVAATAGHLWANNADDFKVCRNEFKHFACIFTQTGKFTATAGAIGFSGQYFLNFTGQVLGQQWAWGSRFAGCFRLTGLGLINDLSPLSLIGVMGPPVIVNMGPLKIEIMGPVADRNYRATRDRNYGASSQG